MNPLEHVQIAANGAINAVGWIKPVKEALEFLVSALREDGTLCDLVIGDIRVESDDRRVETWKALNVLLANMEPRVLTEHKLTLMRSAFDHVSLALFAAAELVKPEAAASLRERAVREMLKKNQYVLAEAIKDSERKAKRGKRRDV